MRARQILASVPPFSAVGASIVGQPLVVKPGKGWAATGTNVGQWYLDGVAVSGATSYTYTPVSSDLGKTPTFIPVGLPFTVTGSVIASLPAITTAPALSGGGAVGQPITLTPGTVTGTPAPTSTFSWRDAGGNELSTSASAFTPVVTGQITVVQTASNGVGSVSRTSNSVTVAAATNPNILVAAAFNVYPRILDSVSNTNRGRGRYSRYPIKICGKPKKICLSWSNATIHYDPDANNEFQTANNVPMTVQQFAIERVSTSSAVAWPFSSDGSRSGVIPAGAIDVQSTFLDSSVFGLPFWPDDEDFNLKIITTVPAITDTFATSRFCHERDRVGNLIQREWGFNPDLATPRATEIFGAPALTAANGSNFGSPGSSSRAPVPVVLGYFDDPTKVRATAWTGDSISEGGGEYAFPRMVCEDRKIPMIQFCVSSGSANILAGNNRFHRAYNKYTRFLVDEFQTNFPADKVSPAVAWADWKADTGRDTVHRTYIFPRASTPTLNVTEATYDSETNLVRLRVPSAKGPVQVGAVVGVYGITPAEFNGLPQGGYPGVADVSQVTVTRCDWDATNGATVYYAPNNGTPAVATATSVTDGRFQPAYNSTADQVPQSLTGTGGIAVFNDFLDERLAAGAIKGICPMNSIRASSVRTSDNFPKWKGMYSAPISISRDGLHPYPRGQEIVAVEIGSYLEALPIS